MLKSFLYRWGQRLIDVYARLMFRMDVQYRIPLPDGPKIIVANHPSITDPFLVMMLLREQVSILVHETFFHVPIFGAYLRHIGHVPVFVDNGRSAFDQAQALLNDGHSIVIFPEGGISPLDGGFRHPRTGAARLALATGAPVIPFGIHLERRRIRLIETKVKGKTETGKWYLRGPYAITVGAAMHFFGDVEDRPHVRSVSGRIMESIIALSQHSAQRMGFA